MTKIIGILEDGTEFGLTPPRLEDWVEDESTRFNEYMLEEVSDGISIQS